MTDNNKIGALPAAQDRAVAAPPSSPSVSPVPASIPSATNVANAALYARRREEELITALSQFRAHGSWAAYASTLLHMMIAFENDHGRQFGSLHHQLAIISAGLSEEAQAIEARRAETQSGSVHESAVHEVDAPK